MAGRIQLTTKGVQDIYFTEEPDYSHFVQLFKRHTNYTTQFVKLDVDGEPQFGKTVRLTIPKDQGDLIKTISLDVELNPIVGASITRTGYIESIGHAMIEYIDMYIGDEKIQHITSDYLQIYSEQVYTQSKQKALEKLIGKYPDRTSDVPVASGVILGHLGPATTSRKLFIDIPFYFYQHPELAVPLCAMCYQEVTIEIKFRELEECVVKTDPPIDGSVQTSVLDYELKSSEVITSNVIVVSNDGLTFASNVNDAIEITGKTTFTGDGIVSPAMNVIVNGSGIYRYENDLWVLKSTDDVSGDVQFSDDGDVIAQIGSGYWVWNGSGYTFTSINVLAAISRDGKVYATQNDDNVEIRSVATSTIIGSIISKPIQANPYTVRLSSDGTKLMLCNDQLIYVYVYTDNWFRLGQDVSVFEIDEVSLTGNGNSFFIYNATERYDFITNTDFSEGVGRLYIYDGVTTQWVEVYRYKYTGGTYASVNDTNTILTIRIDATHTDSVKLGEVTRSVENYDDIVVRSIESITDIGSNVYGVGYQAQGTDTRLVPLFNDNTEYVDDVQQVGYTISSNQQIVDLYISDDSLIYIEISTINAATGSSDNLRVYTRSSVLREFQQIFQKDTVDGNFSLSPSGLIKLDQVVISKTGKYFAVTDRTDHKVLVYTVVGGIYKNIYYDNENSQNIYTSIAGDYIHFSDDETTMTIYDARVSPSNYENRIRIYTIDGYNLDTTITDTSGFTHPIRSVSKDNNRYIKYDSSNEVVKIFTINGVDIITSLPIKSLSGILDFSLSKDGTIAAFVELGFTYIYSYDGFGWNFKSSLFVGLETFKKFNMSDDGNTLSYVSTESTPNRTIIYIYTYIDFTWKRIVQENEFDTNNTRGTGHMSLNQEHFISLFDQSVISPSRSVRVKNLVYQNQVIVINVDQEFSSLYPKQIKSCKVCLEMAFLDEYERSFIKSRRRDYVITQIQQGVYTLPKAIESHTIRTRFVNPVKELYFIIKRVNGKGYDDFVSPFDYDNDKLVSENRLIFYENLKSLELTLNDTQVLDKDTGNFIFLKAIQPAIHHSKTPLIRRFYSYSFACEPEQNYPTGQVNFSLINNQLITTHLTENTTHDRTLNVYALSYNVLRLHKGMMHSIFNI